MTQTMSLQKKPEEDNWDDIEFPETGLLLVNNNNDNGLSTTTRDTPEIQDSSDEYSEEDDYFSKGISNESTPASSASSSIYRVKEMMINSGVIITNNTNNKKFSGLMITRIGGKNDKVISVGDDWDNDIEIPEDGFANLTITATNKRNRSRSSTISVTSDFESDNWDEEEQNTTAKNSITLPKELIIKQINDPSEVLSKSSTTLESFDDDFDFSNSSKLDFSAEALKLHQGTDDFIDKDQFGTERYSSRNSSLLSVPTYGSQSNFESGEEEEEDFFDDIQFPEHMDSLTLASYNDDDDDDFENGLNIVDENIFDVNLLKNKNIITRPNSMSTQHKYARRRESFSIEFNNSSKNIPLISLTSSRAHPKTTSNSPSLVLSPNINKSSSESLKIPTAAKSTFTKNTINRSESSQFLKVPIGGLSSSRKTDTSNSNSISSNKHIKSTPKTNSTTNNKTHYNTFNTPNINSNTNSNTNSILEIMREPKKRQSFGDGTELDEFDDLPINVDRERSYTTSNTRRDRKDSVSSICSKIDHSGSYRRLKKHRKRKKPQLIRNINYDKNLKVVGEMVYNPITYRWDGNDSILKDFDNVLTSPTRPALITNMNNRSTNTKSLQMVGKMKFDPINMCWNNDSSDDEEEIWAKFDYDDDPPQAGDNDTSSTEVNSNDFQVGSEFDVTPGFLAALLASERQHRNEITEWYPDALSIDNDSRFGLRDTALQKSHLYDLRNKKHYRNASNSSSGSNPKINRTGKLFEAAMNLTRHERKHFK